MRPIACVKDSYFGTQGRNLVSVGLKEEECLVAREDFREFGVSCSKKCGLSDQKRKGLKKCKMRKGHFLNVEVPDEGGS